MPQRAKAHMTHEAAGPYPNVAGQFIDVKYSELVSDPLAVVRRIYERLDIRLTDVAAQRMQRLALSRSRYERLS
jgi:LPS sulfotransferase NodH